MTRMPGTARSVRAMLFAVGALNGVAAVWFTVAGVTFESGALGLVGAALFFFAAILSGTLAVVSIVIASRFAHGGDGARTGAVVIGSLIVAGGAVGMMTDRGAWGAGTVAGVLMIALCAGRDTRDWFDRPRP
ncbi:hypothetical protein [Streptomyces sp. AK02-01A]|uniref:hypothetical protein n=1 Tax=Streptomyces sp. AK02-01A TaxID=3028648 RepID=UPI0029BEAFBE|nr:hypothetical protein [Streptomyces sp. AK02-01A]MDX3855605.1 hypothetical protein [Streptomyces sp. AK02-01A]